MLWFFATRTMVAATAETLMPFCRKRTTLGRIDRQTANSRLLLLLLDLETFLSVYRANRGERCGIGSKRTRAQQ